MIYPNLIAEHQAFWCLEAMARGADVTPELMDAVLEGKEPLMADEALAAGAIHDVLNIKSNRHLRWMAELWNRIYMRFMRPAKRATIGRLTI